MNTQLEVLKVLDSVLGLNGRTARYSGDTALLGAIPELDSMAVATVLASLEEHFGVVVEDDEIDGSIFATVGSLAAFVDQKLAG